MRVLCSVLGSPSHANEMRPVARAMAGAGHEVLVAVTPQLANEFADDDNIRVTQALPDIARIWQDLMRSGKFPAPTGTSMSESSVVVKVVAGGLLIGETFPALRSVAKEFKPGLDSSRRYRAVWMFGRRGTGHPACIDALRRLQTRSIPKSLQRS